MQYKLLDLVIFLELLTLMSSFKHIKEILEFAGKRARSEAQYGRLGGRAQKDTAAILSPQDVVVQHMLGVEGAKAFAAVKAVAAKTVLNI